MTRSRRQVSFRAVGVYVLLDAATSVLVYAMLVPLLAGGIVALGSSSRLVVEHMIITARLTVVGLLATLWLRRRRGLARRIDALPSIGTAALVMVVLGLIGETFIPDPSGAASPTFVAYVVAVLEALIFPVLGMLLVRPDDEARLSERGPLGGGRAGQATIV